MTIPFISARALAIAAFTVLFFQLQAAEPPRSWPPDQFLPLTDERIAQLPSTEQASWKNYLEASRALAQTLPKAEKPDFSPLTRFDAPLQGLRHAKPPNLRAERSWYAGAEAASYADHIVSWQTGAGGWNKANDYAKTRAEVTGEVVDLWTNGTIDNDATTTEIRFLALVCRASEKAPHLEAWRESILRGLRYLFVSQYPNGGYPQVYPLVGGYHDAITFNDDAMTQVLEVLREVAAGGADYSFVPADVRKEAAARLHRGVQCILACQLRDAGGQLTVWGQQHDELTLKPCAARNFEPISASAAESAKLTIFLMGFPKPSPEIVSSVKGAIAWLNRTALHDIAFVRRKDDRVVEDTPGAPPTWSRLYEIGTDKPIFGDRDRTVHYAVAEISSERRRGYAWYGSGPAEALKMYSNWRDSNNLR